MTKEYFAKELGFETWEELLEKSHLVLTSGDVSVLVTPLEDGRFAAWDDFEVDLDRVSYFESLEAATKFQETGFALNDEE